MGRARDFTQTGQAIVSAVRGKRDPIDLFKIFYEDLQALEMDVRSLLNAAGSSLNSTPAQAAAQTRTNASSVRTLQQRAQQMQVASPYASSINASAPTLDSGSYGLFSGTPADGEMIESGLAVCKAASGLYLADATDASRPCTHIAVQADGTGGFLCRRAGMAQCKRLLPGSTEAILYLSTVPGFLTDDPTESVGGTRVILQEIGTFEYSVSTNLGTTGLCLVSLGIGPVSNA